MRPRTKYTLEDVYKCEEATIYPSHQNLVGKIFNKIKVLGRFTIPHLTKTGWFLQCHCGNCFGIKSIVDITKGKTTSCGCTAKKTRMLQDFNKYLTKCRKAHVSTGYGLDYITYDDWVAKTIKVECPRLGIVLVHKDTFSQGGGCKGCGNVKSGNKKALTRESYISRALSIHKERYDYSVTDYDLLGGNIMVWCNEHKNFFIQKASNHLRGEAPCCGVVGLINRKTPVSLYLFSWVTLQGKEFLKVGVTGKSPEQRLTNQKHRNKTLSGKVLFSKLCTNGEEAFKYERYLLNTYRDSGGGHVNKGTLPDGHTETIDPKHKEELLQYLNSL